MLVWGVVGDLIGHVDSTAAVGRRVGDCLDSSVGGAGYCGKMRWVGLWNHEDVARRLGLNPVTVVQPKDKVLAGVNLVTII